MIKRSFVIGEEWMYYKIYCGERIADRLLVEVIKPLTASMQSRELIDGWFFIRYKDPHFHLRIRFRLNKLSFLGKVIQKVQKSISPYFKQDLIWKVQTDTYHRELERYGKSNIAEAEDLFFIDSKVCVSALALIEDEKLLFFFVLRSIDQLLSIFKLSLEDKIEFSKNNLDAFKKEFSVDKATNKQLLKKYKEQEKEGIAFLTLIEHEDYAPLLQLLSKKEIALRDIANKTLHKYPANPLEVPPFMNLLSSYIHMMINRYFRDKQRVYELLVYHFLNKMYITQRLSTLKS